MERRCYWRILAGRDAWALILLTRGRPGEPPEPQPNRAPRLSPSWLRSTGADLTPEQLLHERIGQHLCAEAQHASQLGVETAASIATTAAVATLAELGIDLDLPRDAGALPTSAREGRTIAHYRRQGREDAAQEIADLIEDLVGGHPDPAIPRPTNEHGEPLTDAQWAAQLARAAFPKGEESV
ncbi:hypothetical protein [Sphaerisporangium aureirubrum]|uniref:Uncharacterized protein n=2 Tax=Sphaerisporangium aureirubrum TaxID=1544736 RepID=A0ABW1NE69_9ACTN